VTGAARGLRARAAALSAVVAAFALAGCAGEAFVAPEPASGRGAPSLHVAGRDLVVAAHPLAADAGAAILARGGSAVDAAIATQMVLNLVEPQSSGIGGGGFLLHHDAATGGLVAYDGRETAPAEATPDLLMGPDGRPLPHYTAIDGGLSVGTPGLLRMLELAHRRHGRLPWAELFEPAVRLAEDGFEISPRLATSIAAAAARLCAQSPANAYFLAPGCVPKPAGTRLVNPALAASLRAIAAGGADALHRGPLARAIVQAVRGHPLRPGRLSLADLDGYRAVTREPVCGAYRGYRICGMPPPSAGSIAVLQTLGILRHLDLPSTAPGSLDETHRMLEAFRLAYADRAQHVADPAFVPVPVAGLLDDGYLRARAALVRPDRAMSDAPPGRPAGAVHSGADAHWMPRAATTHLSIVDAAGNVVSMTTSIESGFGSLQMVGGFLLNNQLTDFSSLPHDAHGRPVANRVAPGKRPRSTMAPTIVLDPGGRPVAALGSPGGPPIAAYVTKTLVGLIDRGLTIQQAIDAPNYVAGLGPGAFLERGTPVAALADGLRGLGHRVSLIDLNSGVHGLVLGATLPPRDAGAPLDAGAPRDAGAPPRWTGGADPRREGTARGSPGRAASPATR